jgi:uncharacterized membrane protein
VTVRQACRAAVVCLVVALACGRGRAADDGPNGETPVDTPSASDTLPLPAMTGSIRATGTEPFWGVTIDATGIRFRTPEDTVGLRFPLPVAIRAADTLRWNSATPTGQPHEIEVAISPGPCSDGMSDRRWPRAARVIVDRRLLRGCAEGDIP